jgi:2-desacetyl-2-hydroxyethyl bacteriochlorophyllide A dehydrogenase
MKGIVFLGDKKLEIQDFEDPIPGPNDVIIEIKASGMCGSDLKFYRANSGPSSLGLGGYDKPVIAGHEPCGRIVEIGSNVPKSNFQIDTRVMQHHYEGCGTCLHCSTGWQQLCVEGVKSVFGVTGHGAHAKYMKCPASTLVPLREDISFVAGAAISCGTGTAWGALERLDLKARQTIAIFGMGPVGLSAVMLAKKMGSKVIAIDINKQRLERSIEFGADVILNPDESKDLLIDIKDLTKGLGVDASLDASSSPTARSIAVKSVKTWGKACFVGEGGDVTLDVSNDLLRRQVTVIGSWTFSKHGQAECADFVADKKLDIDKLFTHRWSIDQAEEAYVLFDKQSDGKGVIIP